MKTFGVDVSHWEGSIDWHIAAPAIGFAYYKCTEGTMWLDAQFENNRRGCEQAGLPHAPYHFFQPCLDPIQQADFFIASAGSGYKRYIVDIEKPDREVDIVRQLRTFLDRCHELSGIRPAIYTSAGFWNEYIRSNPAWSSRYDLIVAHYTARHEPILPVSWSLYKIWQFSDHFFIPGCKEACDGNWFNGSPDECRKWFGNYKPSLLPRFGLQTGEVGGGGLQMRSHFNGLNIRQEPDFKSKDLGNLAKGEVVEVEELGGKDVWIKHSKGWSCVEKDSYRFMEVLK